jgi:hypothetical protein
VAINVDGVVARVQDVVSLIRIAVLRANRVTLNSVLGKFVVEVVILVSDIVIARADEDLGVGGVELAS